MRTISGVDTSIAAFVGWAAQGPTDGAQRVSSFQDFIEQFGGLDRRSLLGYSVRQFFANGGRDAYVVRLAADDGTPLEPNGPEFESGLDPVGRDGGIYLLDRVDLFDILCVPGETNPTVIAALQGFCRERRAFLVVDSPQGADLAAMQAGPDPAVVGADAANAALYFPWIEAADPLDEDRVRAFPPCGFVAGVFARTDETHGVWKAPAGAGAVVAEAAGPEVPLTAGENDVLKSRGINCIRALPGHGTVVWGSRTLRGADGLGSEWKYVPVRRLALFLEESLLRGTRWVVFEPNDEPLWAQIRLQVGAFLHGLFRLGAFQGSSPRDAYFVKCDPETTTADDIERGFVNILVGFAPLRPAEFVVLKIQQSTGQVRA